VRIKYDNEGRPFEICGRPRCIAVEITTLDRTGHAPAPIEVSHSAPSAAQLGVWPWRVGLELPCHRTWDNFAPAVAISLARLTTGLHVRLDG
jgi:hypothetical protein